MNREDGMLSQEEIDALLGGVDGDQGSEEKVETEATNDTNTQSDSLEDQFSTLDLDTLGEVGNISFGSATTALSTLLNQKVEITTPEVTVVKKGYLGEEFPIPYVSVYVEFTDGFRGSNVLLIKREDASIIADLMLGGDGTNYSEEINEIHLSAVQEAMNQMMGSSATSMSTMFNKRVDISPPVIELMDVKKDEGTNNLPDDESMLKVSFRLKIGNLVDSNIMQVMPVDFAHELISGLMDQQEEASSPVSSNEDTTSQENPEQPSTNEAVVEKQAERQEISSPMPERRQAKPESRPEPNVQAAAFSEFNDFSEPSTPNNIDLLMDIPLTITVELGRTKRKIKDILELSPGSVVELDKLAGEPVDILINQKPIAKGEVVVIDENFGVRITEIANHRDRLQKLN